MRSGSWRSLLPSGGDVPARPRRPPSTIMVVARAAHFRHARMRTGCPPRSPSHLSWLPLSVALTEGIACRREPMPARPRATAAARRENTTPQRRWWPLGLYHEGVLMPSADDPAEHGPASRPARCSTTHQRRRGLRRRGPGRAPHAAARPRPRPPRPRSTSAVDTFVAARHPAAGGHGRGGPGGPVHRQPRNPSSPRAWHTCGRCTRAPGGGACSDDAGRAARRRAPGRAGGGRRAVLVGGPRPHAQRPGPAPSPPRAWPLPPPRATPRTPCVRRTP